MSDLWRMTDSLHLFGDDEEEQNLLSRSNTKVAGLPLPTDQVTAEEQLMLYNGLDASYVRGGGPGCEGCRARERHACASMVCALSARRS